MYTCALKVYSNPSISEYDTDTISSCLASFLISRSEVLDFSLLNTLSADIGSSNGIAYIVSGNSGLNDSEYNNALETTEEILGNT